MSCPWSWRLALRRYSTKPFRPADLEAVAPPGITEAMRHLFVQRLSIAHSWTRWRDSIILGCAGIVPMWLGRAEAWSVVGPCDRYDMIYATRAVISGIEAARQVLGFWRLEATTIAGWRPGERWLEMLGFQPEAYLRQYAPDGTDHRLYARLWPRSPLSLA